MTKKKTVLPNWLLILLEALLGSVILFFPCYGSWAYYIITGHYLEF